MTGFGPPLPTPAVHKFVNYLKYWRRAGSNGADADGTTMELTSVESSMWHSKASVARRFAHKNIVAPNCTLRFWTKLDAMLLAPFNTEETIGLDGISIGVDCRTLAGSANFEVWSREPTTHAGRLVGLIYDIAGEALRGGASSSGDYQVWPGNEPIGAIRNTPLRLALACRMMLPRTLALQSHRPGVCRPACLTDCRDAGTAGRELLRAANGSE